MKWRTRVSAAAWVVVRDAHVAEDIFQNVALKAMTREVSFENEAALMSWAFITARREGIDWLRRHHRETLCLDTEILELLEHEWQAEPAQSAGAKIEALQDCLAAAPESARRLLKLRYFEGYSCEDAGRPRVSLNDAVLAGARGNMSPGWAAGAGSSEIDSVNSESQAEVRNTVCPDVCLWNHVL
jgi:RNA polymerase sigma factor (sigma-70 family)